MPGPADIQKEAHAYMAEHNTDQAAVFLAVPILRFSNFPGDLKQSEAGFGEHSASWNDLAHQIQRQHTGSW